MFATNGDNSMKAEVIAEGKVLA